MKPIPKKKRGEMVNSQVDMYAQRAAKYEKVEEYTDRDMVKGCWRWTKITFV